MDMYIISESHLKKKKRIFNVCFPYTARLMLNWNISCKLQRRLFSLPYKYQSESIDADGFFYLFPNSQHIEVKSRLYFTKSTSVMLT